MFDGLYEALKSDAFQNLQRISRSTVVRPPPAHAADRSIVPHSVPSFHTFFRTA